MITPDIPGKGSRYKVICFDLHLAAFDEMKRTRMLDIWQNTERNIVSTFKLWFLQQICGFTTSYL